MFTMSFIRHTDLHISNISREPFHQRLVCFLISTDWASSTTHLLRMPLMSCRIYKSWNSYRFKATGSRVPFLSWVGVVCGHFLTLLRISQTVAIHQTLRKVLFVQSVQCVVSSIYGRGVVFITLVYSSLTWHYTSNLLITLLCYISQVMHKKTVIHKKIVQFRKQASQHILSSHGHSLLF